ncbi:OsmC family protein [Castellaniella sp. S9]|uniref:OsmC family protein n=1 Tax=Castellaniella sp. S9 TaxID=2993652 RepID=UPI0022B3E5F5|nr:OsmC family protein [Castellaniella sp. S9]
MEKMTFVVSATSEGMVTTATAREHKLMIDADAEMGGEGMGPNPMETVLSALAACESITAHIIAQEMEFDLQGIDFDITAQLDPRGVMGDPNIRVYFEKVEVKAALRTTESDDRIQALKQAVERRCPAYGMIKAANVEMIDHWVKS